MTLLTHSTLEDQKIKFDKNASPLIYLFDTDECLCMEICKQLQYVNFNVKYFTFLNDFESACSKEEPTIVIMDVFFEENEVFDSDYISRLKSKLAINPIVISISTCDDFNLKLTAIRAGVSHFLNKPVSVVNLIKTLKQLTSNEIITPYKALIIHDQKANTSHHKSLLENAGIIVNVINTPATYRSALSQFAPDVIILDLTMPSCTNIEFAQMIKKDSEWKTISILILTTEYESKESLLTIELGDYDFLLKPINPLNLIPEVKAKANHSRWSSRLNNELNNQIRENEFQLSTMNEHDIVSITDVAGRITTVNDKFCQISGYNRDELIGKNHRLIKSDAHSKDFYKNLWETISSGKIWRGTLCNLTKSGKHYWVESTIVPFLDAKGKPYKYVSARTDISELKLSQKRLEDAHVFAGIGTWDWNILTGELHWSKRIWTLFGYEGSIVSTSYENFIKAIHPSDREFVTNAVSNCIEHGVEYNIDHRVVWPDGSIHWLNEMGNVTRDTKGKALHMLGIVRDITNRKFSEIESHRNYQIQQVVDTILSSALTNKDLQTILKEAIKIIINSSIISDKPSGAIFLSNNEDEILTLIAKCGLSPELINQCEKVSFGTSHCGVAASTKKSQFSKCISTKDVITYKGMQPHGHYSAPIMLGSKLLGVLNIYLEENQMLTREEKECIDLLVHTIAIVIDRKYVEQSLIESRKEAESANLSKSKFISSMSHELRTPLNAILGFSQLLSMQSEPALDSYQIENVEEIIKAGEHLLSLINEVLDLASIESENTQLSIETIKLNDVLHDSLQLITPLSQCKNITFNYFMNETSVSEAAVISGNYFVKADYMRLKQVILNLLSNAIKYNCENGEITISITMKKHNLTKVNIKDTGKGLKSSEIVELFKPFNRLGAEQSDIEGTGIGLAITKNLIELMGGEIGIDSKENEGCDFWIILPSGTKPTSRLLKNRVPNTQQPIKVENNKVTYKVLYIEDNPANLRLVTQLLSRQPEIQIYSAHEPYLGMELAYEHKPDLILLDINLPGINGYEVLERLQQNPKTSQIPIVAISANAMPEDIEKGLSIGFVNYITKPINLKELLKTVNSILTKKKNNDVCR